MKVNDLRGTLSVSLKGNRDISDAVKKLKIGESVAARIIRSDGNEALLDIKGNRLRAEFLNGVPDRKVVDLVLTEKTAFNVVFRLAGKYSGENVPALLSMMTLLTENEAKNISMHGLVKFITGGRPDLFEINLFLLGIRKDEKKGGGQADLFSMLRQRGVPFTSLVYMNYLVSMNTPFMVIQYLLQNLIDKRKITHHHESAEEPADDILEILRDESDDVIKGVIDLFSGGDNEKGLYREALIPVDDDFIKCEYIYYMNRFFCSIELSAIGRLDIIVKDYGEILNIVLLPEKDAAEIFLNEKKPELINILEQNNIKNAIIHVSNSKKMVDKISIWAHDFYIKSGFDVKV